MATEILEIIQRMIEFDCSNEKERNQYSDDILIFVDTFSNSVAGTFSLYLIFYYLVYSTGCRV